MQNLIYYALYYYTSVVVEHKWKKTWFTVGFSCTKWHYLILVTLSADNHRLLDFLFRFPKIFLSKRWCVQKKLKVNYSFRLSCYYNSDNAWISLLFSQIKSIITFSGLILWKKFDYVASNDSGKNHMKVYVLGLLDV